MKKKNEKKEEVFYTWAQEATFKINTQKIALSHSHILSHSRPPRLLSQKPA